MALLKVDSVTKSFGRTRVLGGVSFEITQGEVLGFAGPNGAGKTTTMKVISGLVKADSGTTTVGGLRHATHPQKYLEQIGVLLETPAFYLALSAWDQLAYFARIRKRFHPRLVNETLDRVGLTPCARKPVGLFSSGMKQRFGIAMAILFSPRLLILDEPTNGLDPAATIEVRSLVRFLAEEHQMSVLISTHLLHEIEQICDRVVFIRQGLIVHERRLGCAHAAPVVTVQLRTSDNARAVALITESCATAIAKQDGDHVEFRMSQPEVARVVSLLVGDSIDVYEVRQQRESLEDVYLQACGGDRNVQ